MEGFKIKPFIKILKFAFFLASVLTAGCYYDYSPFLRDGGNDAGQDAGLDAGQDAGPDGGIDGGAGQCGGKSDFTRCTIQGALYKYNICVSGECIMPGCGDISCNTPGPNFPVTQETGSHYILDSLVPDQPVVKDVATGLEWQGCSAGLSGAKCDIGAPEARTWIEALEYCNNLVWAGWADWHLPDPDELLSIVDYGTKNPAIYTGAFPNTPKEKLYFWSSSTSSSDNASTFGLNIESGQLGILGEKSSSYYIRCVRSPNDVPGSTPRFERTFPVVDQPVVKDRITGLVWQGCVAGLNGDNCQNLTAIRMTWSEAGDYCSSVDWAGMSGWRLPVVKELSSIVSRRRYKPSIDIPAFPATPSKDHWSATTEYGNDSSWTVEFFFGTDQYGSDRLNSYSVRCVRSESQD